MMMATSYIWPNQHLGQRPVRELKKKDNVMAEQPLSQSPP